MGATRGGRGTGLASCGSVGERRQEGALYSVAAVRVRRKQT
jgi:hypothetical protein